jgi:hypothetical protein
MSWKDELKAEIEDIQIAAQGNISNDLTPHFLELAELIRELIDHIPDDEGELPASHGPATFGVLEGYSGFSGYEP